MPILANTSEIAKMKADAAGAERRAFRAKRGDVKLAIISVLAEGKVSGYELRKKIQARSGGEWRISSGSIYPQLESLMRHDLVDQSYADGIYSSAEYHYYLTPTGRKHLSDNKHLIDAVWDNFKSVKFEGSKLEIELQKLHQAIGVTDSASEEAVAKVTAEVAELRKRIYAILAE
jgi:DNA-binding PadR family transcriptional regulator